MADDLTLSIDIAAAPETVFRFLSDPQLFQQWMGPGAHLSASGVEVHYPGGNVARGTLRESVPNRRIVFGWGYDQHTHGIGPDATTVTIELEPTPEGTRVTLRHAGLDAAGQNEHRKGWTHYLAQLAGSAANLLFAERLPAAVARYVEAWNHPDFAARAALLATCWSEAAIFRDPMGAADGREGLNHYIAGAQQFAPGYRLVMEGAPEQCHGYYRFAWSIHLPDGGVMGRGTNFGQINPQGELVSCIGFWDSPAS
jgi:uncharacterized protein YndB with AHSA1/START domain